MEIYIEGIYKRAFYSEKTTEEIVEVICLRERTEEVLTGFMTH